MNEARLVVESGNQVLLGDADRRLAAGFGNDGSLLVDWRNVKMCVISAQRMVIDVGDRRLANPLKGRQRRSLLG